VKEIEWAFRLNNHNKINKSVWGQVNGMTKMCVLYSPSCTGWSYSGVKRLGREADHSTPASAKVYKMWIYTFTPPYAIMEYCLIS
jgi:hypothetical protein